MSNEDKINKNVINDKKSNNFSNMSINVFDLLCNFVTNFINNNKMNGLLSNSWGLTLSSSLNISFIYLETSWNNFYTLWL